MLAVGTKVVIHVENKNGNNTGLSREVKTEVIGLNDLDDDVLYKTKSEYVFLHSWIEDGRVTVLSNGI